MSANNPMDCEHVKYEMHEAPRCHALNRDGEPCQAPAVSGKERCYYHGGAEGSGAPEKNKNALKHGLYTNEIKNERIILKRLLTQLRE